MRHIYYYFLSVAFITSVSVAADQRNQGVVPGVWVVGTNSELQRPTGADIDAKWRWADWKEDTNGFRVEIYPTTEMGRTTLSVYVGSRVFDSHGEYVLGPNPRFSKFELRNSNDVVMPFLKGVTIQGESPAKIPIGTLPQRRTGGSMDVIWFTTNSGPKILTNIYLNAVYRIDCEGDYRLTVRPAIYEFGGDSFLDRVDLPTVTTKVHLAPTKP